MIRTQGGSVLYVVPNFKWIAVFVQQLLGGPESSKLGHMTQATPT